MKSYIITVALFLSIVMNQIRFNPYKVGLIDFAKLHRKESTKAESLFWWIVRNRKMLWYKFKRENSVWSFILDFYCSKLLLWIEIDWWYHDEMWEEDENREIWMKSKWIRTIRFTNDEVEKNLEWVAQYLEDIIRDREKELGL